MSRRRTRAGEPTSRPPAVTSRAAVGRGDLARLLSAQVSAGEIAALGYTPMAPQRRDDGRPTSPTDPVMGAHVPVMPTGPEPDADDRPLAPTLFWRATGYEPTAAGEARPEPEELLDLTGAGRRRPPSVPPLERWSRLVPALADTLRRSVPGRALDLRAIVLGLATGRTWVEVPRRVTQRWPARLVVTVDRSEPLIPLWDDQDAVTHRILRVLPRSAVHLRYFADRPPPARPSGDAAELVLSDLGAYGGPSASLWRSRGRRALGARARGPSLALLPAPRSAWPSPELEDLVLKPWGRAGVEPSRAHRHGVEDLLTALAPATRIEPGLLRRLRRVLGLDWSAEVEAWMHPDLARSPAGAAWRSREVMERRRDLYAAWKDREAATASLAVLRRWHEGVLPDELWFEELIVVRGTRGLNAEDADGLERYERRLCATVEATPEGMRSLLFPYVRRAVRQRLGSELIGNAQWARVVERVAEADPTIPRPAGLDPADMRATGEGPSRWAVWQVAGGLEVRPQDVPVERGSLLGWVDGGGAELRVEIGASRAEVLRAPDGGRVHVVPSNVAGGARRAVRGPDANWAVASGRDRYGWWAEARFGDVPMRFRWIEPGTFWMGSDEREIEEASEFESPRHLVTLSSGFWLAETPCTQRQWVALGCMRDTAHGEADERPVEDANWRNVEALLKRIPAYRLPTEAEWEYACRAGTYGARYGALNDVAWYSGNTALLQPVRSKAPNAWGLFDMLGAVWEWCADGVRKYNTRDARDPVGAVTPQAVRMRRGGSWRDEARCARAAFRGWHGTASPSDPLGFRLARGPWRSQAETTGRVPDGVTRPAGAPSRDGGPEAGLVLVQTPRARLVLSASPRPRWASAIGRDAYGLWADLTLGDMSLRFRWVPPIELGWTNVTSVELFNALDDHRVRDRRTTLERGFWLQDRPLTAAVVRHLGLPTKGEHGWAVGFGPNGLGALQTTFTNVLGLGDQIVRVPDLPEWLHAHLAGTPAARDRFRREAETRGREGRGFEAYLRRRAGLPEPVDPPRIGSPNPLGIAVPITAREIVQAPRPRWEGEPADDPGNIALVGATDTAMPGSFALDYFNLQYVLAHGLIRLLLEETETV